MLSQEGQSSAEKEERPILEAQKEKDRLKPSGRGK